MPCREAAHPGLVGNHAFIPVLYIFDRATASSILRMRQRNGMHRRGRVDKAEIQERFWQNPAQMQ